MLINILWAITVFILDITIYHMKMFLTYLKKHRLKIFKTRMVEIATKNTTHISERKAASEVQCLIIKLINLNNEDIGSYCRH